MSGETEGPAQQFSDALQAAATAMGKWRQQVAAATSEALEKIEPAARAAVAAARAALTGDRGGCQCSCRLAHPDDLGICDGKAVLTRRLDDAEVSLCAPCAVAQGVAEMPR